jgi:hypothetical protein
MAGEQRGELRRLPCVGGLLQRKRIARRGSVVQMLFVNYSEIYRYGYVSLARLHFFHHYSGKAC